MNALVFSVLAAFCAATSNFFFRVNSGSGESSGKSQVNGYLCTFYLIAFLSSIAFFPDIWTTKINFTIVAIGASVGLLNVGLMLTTNKALKTGPAGLSFAFLNSSAIFPGMIMFLLLGPSFGFTSSWLQGLGLLLVVAGLFYGANSGGEQKTNLFPWLKFAIGCLLIQILALTLIQSRCLLYDCEKLGTFFTPFAISPADDVWFMPAQFGTAFILQLIIFLQEKRGPSKNEMLYGSLGGMANLGSTFLLLLATKWATPEDKGLLFPVFAVGTILLSNVWANRIYKEKFNVISNSLNTVGVFLALAA